MKRLSTLSHESEAISGARILDVTGPYQNGRAARPSLWNILLHIRQFPLLDILAKQCYCAL